MEILRDKRITLAVSAAFALFTLAEIARMVGNFKQIPHISVSAVQTTHTPPQNIANWHFFGKFDGSPTDLPQTQLELVLQGTIVIPKHTDASYALISNGNTPAKMYRSGDEVMEGVFVQNVLPDHVVLNHNGALEILPLPVPKIIIPSGE